MAYDDYPKRRGAEYGEMKSMPDGYMGDGDKRKQKMAAKYDKKKKARKMGRKAAEEMMGGYDG